MKVLFISQYFHPEPFSNNDIARSLVERGHEVEAVSCVPNYPEGMFYPGYSNSAKREEKWKGIRILRAHTIPRGKRAFTLFLNYLYYPFSALLTIFKRGSGNYSVTFTSMPSPIFQCIVAVFMKYFKGVPAVYWVQDIWPESLINTIGIKNNLLKHILRKICSFLYSRADIVLIQSEAFRPKLEALGIPNNKVAFFPNTAPDNFTPISRNQVQSRISVLLPPSDLRFMFAGNVGESQNLDIIIEAAQRLKSKINAQWVVVGVGRDFERLQQLAVSRGVNDVVHFLGRHPMSDMPEFYALADAMIICLKNTEIFSMTIPYKLQSYMKAGKPVIGCISGETRRIIEDARIGFCAEAEDVDGFCQAALDFSTLNHHDRDLMRKNSIRYFEDNFNSSVVHDRLEKYLYSVQNYL